MYDPKCALVIAGGQWQVPIIQFLKDQGYRVVVADPYEHSPGVRIADGHLKFDVKDVAGLSKAVINDAFSFVVTDQSDISVETVSIISRQLGLPANPLHVVQRFTNKYISREYAKSIQTPIPGFFQVGDIQSLYHAIDVLQLPVILKPVDLQSSRGIFKIDAHNQDNCIEFFEQCMAVSSKGYILVEQFVAGTELTFEGICSGGIHKTVAISEKRHFRTGIASDLIYPAQLPEDIRLEMIQANDRYVESSGLLFGITHAEYMYDAQSGKFYLIEIACRGGGTLISSHIVPWVSQINVYQILLDSLRGKHTDLSNIVVGSRSAILHFFEFPNGRVTRIQGLDEIRALHGVAQIKLDFEEGSVISSATDDRSRQGFCITFAETRAENEQLLWQVISLLKVEVAHV